MVPTTLAHLWVAATVSSQPNTPTVIDSNPPPVLTITPTHLGQAAAPANACTIDSNGTSAACQCT